MAERDFLTEAFNDCIERLQSGASVDDCLRRYPQFAGDLRPMLFSVEAVRRAQPLAGEAAQAQMNARFRFEAALQQKTRRRGLPVVLRYMAAAVALVLLASGVLVAASQSALPGDPLYGVKRAGEQALMALSGGSDDGRLNDRRIEEIRGLLAAGRTEEVSFDGVVTAQNGADWQIGGLPVRLSDDAQGADSVQVRDLVRVFAFTTPNGQLIAHRLQLLERGLTPSPTPPPTAAPTVAPTATETPSPTGTATPSPTASATRTPTATASATVSPTASPTASPTTTQTPTVTRTPAASPTPGRTPTASPAVCVPAAPPGWFTWRVQPGDTLSGLAAATGSALEPVLAANCLTLQSVLIAGQPLFLPRLPATVAPPAQPPPAQPTDDSGNSGSGSDGSGHDTGDDHGGSGNSGSGSGSSGSGSSGSGGSGSGSGGGDD